MGWNGMVALGMYLFPWRNELASLGSWLGTALVGECFWGKGWSRSEMQLKSEFSEMQRPFLASSDWTRVECFAR